MVNAQKISCSRYKFAHFWFILYLHIAEAVVPAVLLEFLIQRTSVKHIDKLHSQAYAEHGLAGVEMLDDFRSGLEVISEALPHRWFPVALIVLRGIDVSTSPKKHHSVDFLVNFCEVFVSRHVVGVKAHFLQEVGLELEPLPRVCQTSVMPPYQLEADRDDRPITPLSILFLNFAKGNQVIVGEYRVV